MRTIKKIIHKIKLWYWKHTDTKKYYEELFGYVFKNYAEAAEQSKMAFQAAAEAMHKFCEIKNDTHADGYNSSAIYADELKGDKK